MATPLTNTAKIDQRQFKQRLNYMQEVYRALPAEVVSFSKGIATVKTTGVDYGKSQPVQVKAPVVMINLIHYKLKKGDKGVLLPVAAPLKGGKVFMETDLANCVFLPYAGESWDWTKTLIDKLNLLVEQLNNWKDGEGVLLKGANPANPLPTFDK